MRLAILLFAPFFLTGQDSTFSTDVKVINVLATVHNKQGQIISNLNKEDFTLEEEGHPQVIKYFSRETNQPLTLGLLVDTSASQRRVMGDEVRASLKFLQQVLREKDQAFVIHFDHDVELLQDLTSDRRKLERSLEGLDTPRDLQRGTPGSSGRRGGGGTALYDAVLLASNEIMKNQTGRKALIILSDGVDNGSKVGLMDGIEAAQKADTLVYSILFSDEQGYGGMFNPGMGGGGRGGGRRGGRQTPMPRGGGVEDGKRVLQRISLDTGAGFFEVTKKLPIDQTFGRIEEELRNQYSIGYISDQPSTPGVFRRIHLATAGQKNLSVQSRAGYYGR